jgi:hypothetical protein
MRVSSTCSSVVGGLAYIILHLHRYHTMAKVQETFCYLLSHSNGQWVYAGLL